MTSTATRPSSVAPTVARRPGLDVLRGVAATAVVVSHVAFVSGVVNPERWSSQLRLLLPRLDVGVPIFFVLSGLLIARPFLRAVADDRPAPAPVRYLLRRAARIYPLYWVVLAVSLAAASGELPSVAKLLSYVGLVHIYRPATAIGPITQSWSLATELSFYLLVPVWFWACRRVLDRFGVSGRERRLRWMGLALVGWVVVALAWRAGVVAATDTFDYTKAGAVDVRGALLTWLPNHLDEFAVGIGLAVLLELRRDRDRLAAIGPVGRIACYVVAAAALWIASAHLDLPPLHTGFDGFQTLARHALFLVTAALVVAPSALAVAGRRGTGGDAGRKWGARVAAAVGLGSYGVYLWHQFVADRWMARPGHRDFQVAFPTMLVVVLAGSAALAFVGYWLVEKWPQPMVEAVLDAPAAADAGAPRQLGTSPTLDGLRGLSILAVLGTHVIFVDPPNQHGFFRGGFLGVDVFLVLSGFLISATLLRERDRTSTVKLGGFLRRRAERLVPPMVVFLAIHAVVVLILGDSFTEEIRQAVLALTFLSNWQLSFGHQPPYDLVHLWSLAVEGQLYVLCGLAVYWARKRLDRTPLVVGSLVAAAFAVAIWRLVEFRHGVDLEALYQRTDARADSMIIGGLGAVLWRARLVSDDVARRVGVVAGVAIFVSWWWFEGGDGSLFAGGFSLIAVAVVAVILAALVPDRSPVAAVAGWAPLRAIGRMSYSLYLWHLPVYRWVSRGLPDVPWIPRYAIAVVLSFVVAALSYRFVEQPFLRRRRAVAPADQVSHTATMAAADNVIR